MTMKLCRRLAAVLAVLTILSGGSCKLFQRLPSTVTMSLSICAIILSIATIFVVVQFHRCPQCHNFIPITLRPDICPHCEAPLN